MDCMLVIPQNSSVGALLWWSLEVVWEPPRWGWTVGIRSPHDGVGVLIRGGREVALCFCHLRIQTEDGHLQARNRALTGNPPTLASDLRLPASRTVRKKCLLFQPHSWWYSGIAAWAKTAAKTSSGKSHRWMLNIWRQFWWRSECLHCLKISPHRSLIHCKWKSRNDAEGKNTRYLDRMIKWMSRASKWNSLRMTRSFL